MVTRRKTFGLAAGVLGGLVLVGLGIYLMTVGLDQADKLASVIGAFAGLASFSLGASQLVRQRSASRQADRDEFLINNTITGDVSGNVVQAHTIEGGISLRQPE